MNAFKAKGVTVGIYTSKYMWQNIMGGFNNCAKFGNLQLWYPHYDGSPSFSDFTPFAGWTKPAIKQYVGDTTACGLGVDLDYYP